MKNNLCKKQLPVTSSKSPSASKTLLLIFCITFHVPSNYGADEHRQKIFKLFFRSGNRLRHFTWLMFFFFFIIKPLFACIVVSSSFFFLVFFYHNPSIHSHELTARDLKRRITSYIEITPVLFVSGKTTLTTKLQEHESFADDQIYSYKPVS